MWHLDSMHQNNKQELETALVKKLREKGLTDEHISAALSKPGVAEDMVTVCNRETMFDIPPTPRGQQRPSRSR